MVSHTTTGEWQSFELRMRRRRAERLLLRAEIAFEAGCLDDARQCVTEARALVPALPGLDEVERNLSAPVPTVQRKTTLHRVAASVAILAVMGTAGVGGWMMMRTGAGSDLASAPPRPSASTASPPARAAAPSLPSPSDVLAAEITAPTVETTAEKPLAPGAVRPAFLATVPDAPLTQLPGSQLETTPIRAVASESPVAPTVPSSPEPSPVTALNLPALPMMMSVPEPSPEPAVKSVLDRYAAAYSALDVDAAQRVWPGVNRGALARAFDSLATQQVALGTCRIDVIGASATAACTGSMSWSPKVGDGGQQTEARSWTFELARGAAGWEIVSARVQNR